MNFINFCRHWDQAHFGLDSCHCIDPQFYVYKLKPLYYDKHETWSNTPKSIRELICRDTVQSDIKSEMELLKK